MSIASRLFTLGSSIIISACGASAPLGGSALIKEPVAQQCARQGIQGCADLVDGIILYVDGDKSAAGIELRRAAAKNAPADLRRFAAALEPFLPTSTGREIAALLAIDGPAGKGGGVTAEVATEPEGDIGAAVLTQPWPESASRIERAQLAMSVQTDPKRLTTESVFPLRDPDKAICSLAAGYTLCVSLESGPLIVTDATTPPGCETELVIGAATDDGLLGWLAPTHPGFHGSRFLVRPDQRVVVAARNADPEVPGDERCFVTWAAFRPRL